MSAAGHPYPDALTDPLDGMIRLAHSALGQASTALLAQRPVDAETMATCERALRALHREVEEHAALMLMARTELMEREMRTAVAAAQVNADAESLGELARQLADLARTRRTRSPLPPESGAVLRAMGQLCLDAVGEAAAAVATPQSAGNIGLDSAGSRMGELRRQLYQHLLSGPRPVEVATTVDATIAARCYELGVGHAVSVAWHGMLLVEPVANP